MYPKTLYNLYVFHSNYDLQTYSNSSVGYFPCSLHFYIGGFVLLFFIPEDRSNDTKVQKFV